MSVTAVTESRLSNVQLRVLTLLVISIFINYIDRGALGVAAHDLRTELRLDPADVGKLLSAFFWTYASFQIVAGWFVDRYDVRWVFGAGFLLWSGATWATGLAHSFATLLALRLVLGVGEAVAYPAYSKILAGNFPQKHRGTANGLIDMGSKAGPALGTLLGGLLVAHYGWRALFLSIGLASLIWLVPWVLWGPRDRALPAAQRADAPGILEILARREAWGTFLGLAGGNYFWYFLLFWLPSYLQEERHFSTSMMAILGSVPFWGIALSSAIGGWASDRWIARGGTPTVVRKFFAVTGLLMGTLILPAAIVQDRVLSMALLIAASLSFGLCSSNIWAITQTLAGPVASGKWTGIQNAIGNVGGITAPWVTGLIVAKTGSFLPAFAAASLAATGGALSFLLIVRKVAAVRWTR